MRRLSGHAEAPAATSTSQQHLPDETGPAPRSRAASGSTGSFPLGLSCTGYPCLEVSSGSFWVQDLVVEERREEGVLGGLLRAGMRSVWESGLSPGKVVAGWVTLPNSPGEREPGLLEGQGELSAVRETLVTGLFLSPGGNPGECRCGSVAREDVASIGPSELPAGPAGPG